MFSGAMGVTESPAAHDVNTDGLITPCEPGEISSIYTGSNTAGPGGDDGGRVGPARGGSPRRRTGTEYHLQDGDEHRDRARLVT